MLSNIYSRGSGQRTLWRVGTLIMLLGLIAALFSTGTSQAAPPAQAGTCTQAGVATIIDPTGGAVQVRMYPGSNPANVEDIPTSIQRIELNGGQVVYGYCIDSVEARLTDVPVCLLSEISNVRLAYLIAKYPPDSAGPDQPGSTAGGSLALFERHQPGPGRSDHRGAGRGYGSCQPVHGTAERDQRHQPQQPAGHPAAGSTCHGNRPRNSHQRVATAGVTSDHRHAHQGWLPAPWDQRAGCIQLRPVQPDTRDDRRQRPGEVHGQQHRRRVRPASRPRRW